MAKRSYVLYIDESGNFQSSLSVKSIAGAQKNKNQIVGFLVPDDGSFSELHAESILRAARESAGGALDEESHAKNEDNQFVNAAAEALLEQLPKLCIQPVRMVNREQMDYGGHDATYIQIVAELIVRIFAQKSREADGRISIRLHGANVVRINDEDGNKVIGSRGVETIPAQEYVQRIREALAFVTVRQGFSESAREWELVGVKLDPARKIFALQICDLLSNSSVDRFSRILDATRITYQSLLGAYDFSLKMLPILERIDDHLEGGEPALAVRLIAEQLIHHEVSQSLGVELKKRQDSALQMLARLSASLRRPQSDLLISWVMQLERQRFLDTGERIARWLLDNVIEPVRKLNPQDLVEIDEFEYGIRRWHLKLLTHQGRLKEARKASDRLDALVPSIAGSVDSMPRLLEGQVAQAVHFTDCLEFDEAINRLMKTDAIHTDMLALFGKKYSIDIRSEARGKTLSSWSQAEAYSSKGGDLVKLNEARRLNELAAHHFSSRRDISQLQQYRCQIETLACNFQAARKALAGSMGLSDISHKGIGVAILKPSFEMLHWWRLGANALKADPASDEAKQFVEIYNSHAYSGCNWSDSEFCEYPVQGLFRQAASISSSLENSTLAMELLLRLANIADPTNKPVFGAIHIAAMLETAFLLYKFDKRSARLVLGESPNSYRGLSEAIKRCRPVFIPFSGLSKWLDKIDFIRKAVLANDEKKVSQLLELSSVVGY